MAAARYSNRQRQSAYKNRQPQRGRRPKPHHMDSQRDRQPRPRYMDRLSYEQAGSVPRRPTNEAAIEIYQWISDDGLDSEELRALVLEPLIQNDLHSAAAGIKRAMGLDPKPDRRVQGYLGEIWCLLSEAFSETGT